MSHRKGDPMMIDFSTLRWLSLSWITVQGHPWPQLRYVGEALSTDFVLGMTALVKCYPLLVNYQALIYS